VRKTRDISRQEGQGRDSRSPVGTELRFRSHDLGVGARIGVGLRQESEISNCYQPGEGAEEKRALGVVLLSRDALHPDFLHGALLNR